jgi:deoxyinosine 3'endonuclease (endonuclease V)
MAKALRTRSNIKPLYISPGHRVSMNSAHELVMKCVTKYKLPAEAQRRYFLKEIGRSPVQPPARHTSWPATFNNA